MVGSRLLDVLEAVEAFSLHRSLMVDVELKMKISTGLWVVSSASKGF